jgi:hypothetical protein
MTMAGLVTRPVFALYEIDILDIADLLWRGGFNLSGQGNYCFQVESNFLQLTQCCEAYTFRTFTR